MGKSLEQLRREVDLWDQNLRTALQNIKTENQQLKKCKAKLEDLVQAQQILQKVALDVENTIHSHLSRIVTKCLQMVFDKNIEFEIAFDTKYNKTTAELFLLKDGKRLSPLESTGGGVVDVAAFALRLSCLSLRVPKGRLLLCLDEPFRFVSPDLRLRIREMLEMLSDELGIQLIITTNMPDLITGKVISI